MNKSRSSLAVFIPGATIFFSSGCIMILELVASRLTARHLGSSLYTWTSVIGVILAGITIGNYIGGRIADRFPARKTLAVLFGISSVACVGIVVLNNIVGEWVWLWRLNWPAHIFIHVVFVFMLPSTLLGTISPVVAKMALDKGLATGRTIGAIYAWGAAGSIAGTFLAGFYLITTMGTIAIIWTIGAALLLMGILYWSKLWVLYIWASVFTALMAMGMAPVKWAQSSGSSLRLREEHNPNILYQDETPYCYVAVKQIFGIVDKRAFMQDKLMHSEMVMGDILDLRYSYVQIHAAVTQLLSEGRKRLSVLVIGGGGYVFPRYVEKVWPGSRVDVVEIDPGVTEAAIEAFGLQRDTAINTFTMDARYYVSRLLKQTQTQGQEVLYDFIYEDALSDYSTPYQLTTKEFNDQIACILTDNGVYMIELIDIYDSGLFLGSFINTLEQTFPHVYVVTQNEPGSARNTFVIIASKREFNPENLGKQQAVKDLDLWILNKSEIEILKEKAGGIILTDNYAPVETMLAPVVRRSSVDFLSEKYHERAQEFRRRHKLDEAIAEYRKLIEITPTASVPAYNEIAMMRTQQNRLAEAAEAFQQLVRCNEQASAKANIANVHLDLGFLLKKLQRPEESRKHFLKAMQGWRKKLAARPDSPEIVYKLGVSLAELGNYIEAILYFQQAVSMNPFDIKKHSTLAQALVIQERYDEAIDRLQKGIRFMLENERKGEAEQLQVYLEDVKFRKLKATK
ncbi:MAG: fused MFS/spermidine synthase [Planctomycetota bacterium]